MTPPTQFEREILDRVLKGIDPWDGRQSETRAVSQGLGRLIRKGLLRHGERDEPSYMLTDECREALVLPPGSDLLPAAPEPPTEPAPSREWLCGGQRYVPSFCENTNAKTTCQGCVECPDCSGCDDCQGFIDEERARTVGMISTSEIEARLPELLARWKFLRELPGNDEPNGITVREMDEVSDIQDAVMPKLVRAWEERL